MLYEFSFRIIKLLNSYEITFTCLNSVTTYVEFKVCSCRQVFSRPEVKSLNSDIYSVYFDLEYSTNYSLTATLTDTEESAFNFTHLVASDLLLPVNQVLHVFSYIYDRYNGESGGNIYVRRCV